MTMFPTRTPKFATAAQFQKIREYYGTVVSEKVVRSIIRIYEIEGWTMERAEAEIRRLEDLREKGLPTVPEGYEL